MPTPNDFDAINSLYSQSQSYIAEHMGDDGFSQSDEMRLVGRYSSALFLAVEACADLLNYRAFVEANAQETFSLSQEQGEPVAEGAAEDE
mgnify:FL=1